MQIFNILVFFIFTVACTSTSNVKRTNLEEIYQGAGIEQHFLADLPSWANFSTVGACGRDFNIRYINFNTLYKSFSLEYEALVQLQYTLNLKFQALKKQKKSEALLLKDESYLFYTSYQQIIGGSRDFVIPKFDRIHLIWIDDALKDQNINQRFVELMRSEKMEQGHPVFVSTCLSADALQDFIAKNGYDKMGVKAISAEMFTPFNNVMDLSTSYSLNFSKLFGNKQLILFAPWFPQVFTGEYRKQKF